MPDNSLQGEIVGLNVADGRPIRIAWSGGIIASIEHVDAKPSDRWIAPPLFDVQVNGYAGVDFQQDNLTVDDLLSATRKLRADGCTRFLLTLVTDEWSA